MKVADVMTSPARAAHADDSLNQASRVMWDHDLGALPVVDARGRAIAMLTDRDICMAAYTRGKPLPQLTVREAMSMLVYTCHPEDKLSAAERTMRIHQVRRLPVVDDQGQVVGVLSINDVCRTRALSLPVQALDTLLTDVIITLAAIGQARLQDPASNHPEAKEDPFEKRNIVTSAQPPPGTLREPASLFRF
jgi:CBS-domain-containing membrane protein